MLHNLDDGVIEEVLDNHADEHVYENLSKFVGKYFDEILDEMIENHKRKLIKNFHQRDIGVIFPTFVEQPTPRRRSDNIEDRTPEMEEYG